MESAILPTLHSPLRKMYLRLRTQDDLPALATIAADAYIDDEFAAWRAPLRHEFPEAWRRSMLEVARRRMSAPGTWGIVCCEKSPDAQGGEEVMGHAAWRRNSDAAHRSSSVYARKNTDIAARIEKFLLKVEEDYVYYCRPNPAMSPSGMAMLRKWSAEPELGPLGSGVENYWHLDSLTVSPNHQRKGVGAMLVSWGLDRCREEAQNGKSLPAALIASPAGRYLYAKMDFKVIAWKGEGMNMEGGGVMVWDEQETWVRPVDAEEGPVLNGGRAVEVVLRQEKS